jgi:hypothetical protein
MGKAHRLDLRNFPAEVRRFIGEQRDLHVDGGLGWLKRDLQVQALEQRGPVWPIRGGLGDRRTDCRIWTRRRGQDARNTSTEDPGVKDATGSA